VVVSSVRDHVSIHSRGLLTWTGKRHSARGLRSRHTTPPAMQSSACTAAELGTITVGLLLTHSQPDSQVARQPCTWAQRATGHMGVRGRVQNPTADAVSHAHSRALSRLLKDLYIQMRSCTWMRCPPMLNSPARCSLYAHPQSSLAATVAYHARFLRAQSMQWHL
jgi:hypothetical protein